MFKKEHKINICSLTKIYYFKIDQKDIKFLHKSFAKRFSQSPDFDDLAVKKKEKKKENSHACSC